jgi:hypothetical protein
MKKYPLRIAVLIGACTLSIGVQAQVAQMSINTMHKTDSAALTIWGRTIVVDTDHQAADVANAFDTHNEELEYLDEYLLWVEHGVISKGFVYASVDRWADYVFAKDYQVPELAQVRAFIKNNKHLPGIPSIAEISQRQGYSMKEMDKNQMVKIEELFLYLIDQGKEIEKLEQDINRYDAADLEKLAREIQSLKVLTTKLKKD